jgi:hypothetical protein
MAKQLCPVIKQQIFDANGDPLALGKVYSYVQNSSTPKSTYSDSAGTPNTNPVTLDGDGRANIWLGTGGYKFVIKSPAGVTLYTVDNVYQDFISGALGGDITGDITLSGALTTKKTNSWRWAEAYTGVDLEAQLTNVLAEAPTNDVIAFIKRSIDLAVNPSGFIGAGLFLNRKIASQNVPANEFLLEAAYDPYVLIFNCTPKVNIASAVRAANVVTVTTLSPHGLYPTSSAYISGIPIVGTTFNGLKTIVATPTAYTFTFAQAAANETATPNTGTCQGSGNAGIVFQTSQDDSVSGESPLNNYAVRIIRQSDGTFQFAITQKFVELGTDALNRLYFNQIDTIAANAGVGTTDQGGAQGNFTVAGSVGSSAQVNNTTGRAGLFLKNLNAVKEVWLTTDANGDLGVSTGRDPSYQFFKFFMDGTGKVEAKYLGTSIPIQIADSLAIKRKALVLVNGANNNCDLAAGGFLKITGPTGAFSVSGLFNSTLGANVDGQEVTLYNSVAQQMTITNEGAGSTATNRITTLTGADVVLRAGTSCARFIYDSGASRWILTGSN